MAALIVVGFWLACIIGWCVNVFTAIKALIALPQIAEITGLLVAQLIGIPVAPLGVILGWFVW